MTAGHLKRMQKSHLGNYKVVVCVDWGVIEMIEKILAVLGIVFILIITLFVICAIIVNSWYREK